MAVAMLMGFSYRGLQRWCAEVHQAGSGRLYVITANTWEGWNDCPIMVEGKVLYDYPERIPHYAKRLTVKAFKWIEENGEELKK